MGSSVQLCVKLGCGKLFEAKMGMTTITPGKFDFPGAKIAETIPKIV